MLRNAAQAMLDWPCDRPQGAGRAKVAMTTTLVGIRSDEGVGGEIAVALRGGTEPGAKTRRARWLAFPLGRGGRAQAAARRADRNAFNKAGC